MKCVVCGARITGEPQYANSWEAAQKRFPCCGTKCASEFDTDKHWLPGQVPAPAEPAVQENLLAVCKKRLVAGDKPTVLLHEMLNAGVDSAALRALFLSSFVSASKSQQLESETTRDLNVLGALTGLITGHFHFHASNPKNKAEPALVDAALADLDRWEAWRADT